jgi:alpha-tubulin suppressor-like RCC1 family protein
MRRCVLLFFVLGFDFLTLKAQPVITLEPTSQTIASGGTLTLSVTASGQAPVYQWLKDDGLIRNATNSVYTITNAGAAHSGVYRAWVTNVGGMVLSLPARITVDNTSLLGWGNNEGGQLGNGTFSNSSVPIRITTNVTTVSGGDKHSLFVRADGTLWAAGLNTYGQLGVGSTFSTNSPVLVATNVTCAAAGLYHSLYVSASGTLASMGGNGFGQLGNGSNADSSLPVVVASNVVAASAGQNHSLFIKTDGRLWAFGANYFGQLGDGTLNNTNRPMLVASNVISAAAGYGHSLFVKSDKSLWAMGYNQFGQLGNGTLASTNRPIMVATNVASVASGYGHSLYITQDGVLWAMGDNLNGQLGTGNLVQTNPVPSIVASNVVAVAGANSHTLFVKQDGSLWTMGNNSYGQLGNGTNVNSAVPIMLPATLTAGCLYQGPLTLYSMISGHIYSNATVFLSGLHQVYSGNPINVNATTIPSGLATSLTYNGLASAPTNPGSYTVIGKINDPNYYGSVTNTLLIGVPPQNFSAILTNNNQSLTVTLTGTPNYPYFLQKATNLSPPVFWESVLTNNADENGNWLWTMTNLINLPQSFFRSGAF